MRNAWYGDRKKGQSKKLSLTRASFKKWGRLLAKGEKRVIKLKTICRLWG